MYWADGNTNKIEIANLDGSQRHTIHQDTNAHYFGLTIYQGSIFYTDWVKR